MKSSPRITIQRARVEVELGEPGDPGYLKNVFQNVDLAAFQIGDMQVIIRDQQIEIARLNAKISDQDSAEDKMSSGELNSEGGEQ